LYYTAFGIITPVGGPWY